MEPVIHLRGAVCLLGRFPALAGVDLTVERGEIVMLQGPNGAGKTTLLRLCAGLQTVASGEARVLGVDLAADPTPVRVRVGLLAHATFLYDDLTVTDNVEFWTAAARADVGDARRAMQRLGLGGRLADVKVSRLSTGQRRRVALAVLVARRPELWLLDEPHAGLDSEGRDLIDALVVEAADAGATVLLASHELDRAVRLAPRHVTITGGTIAADDRPGLTVEADRAP
ncbi:heme ABC exporter ATP-binding protein CcmA [Actinomarinicola tropica]|uniref:Heme ABC exporter ATP-binding protein CcmA n=1 Tax=Actinomarinicola tropica TaxID=2789776 RepID=A0A5Q2RCF8_9ACTN|nr:heme ABC exporter ATP-binding protein CcmA [Actinomarinicola tropica]QGG94528.1 heme ABC exporter ATP-binding protein CcmA [Actinomarinicola tropica]